MDLASFDCKNLLPISLLKEECLSERSVAFIDDTGSFCL